VAYCELCEAYREKKERQRERGRIREVGTINLCVGPHLAYIYNILILFNEGRKKYFFLCKELRK
jgi:hypothetical protein